MGQVAYLSSGVTTSNSVISKFSQGQVSNWTGGSKQLCHILLGLCVVML